jgi:PEP-CTERM motif-containing protein
MIRKMLFVGALVAMPAVASAGILDASFESAPGSFDGWADSFGSRVVVLDAGTIGVTDGVQSLALTLEGDGFAWDIQKSFSSELATFSAAVAAGGNLEFDLTYDTSTIPQNVVTYLNLLVALNDGSWSQSSPTAADTNGSTNSTTHVVMNLAGDLGAQTIGEGATYAAIYFGFNGDWVDAADPRNTENATIYLDNIVITPEPASLALLGLGGLAIAGRRRA